MARHGFRLRGRPRRGGPHKEVGRELRFFTKVSLIRHGIVPNTKPAGAAGGGECTEFNGQLIRLVAPALEQVRVVVDTIFGEHEQVYKGPGASTTLKVAGVDLVSAGDAYGRDEDCEAIVSANPAEGVYRKAVVKVDSGVGTVLLGDVAVGPRLTQTVKRAMPAEEVAGLIMGRGYASEIGADSLPDEAQIYNCNGISKR